MKCIIIDHDTDSSRQIELLAKEIKNISIVKSCATLKEAEEVLTGNKIEVLIVNFQSPGVDHFELFNFLSYPRPILIAVASDIESAKEAFDMDASDFILKPVSRIRLTKSFAKVSKLNHNSKNRSADSHLFVKENHRLTQIKTKNIYLIEALADYVNIYTAEKRYTVLSTLKGILHKLPSDDFMRVHKSYILRLDAITQIEDSMASVGKRTIPISNTYKRDLLIRLKVL